jgi:TonB family protein
LRAQPRLAMTLILALSVSSCLLIIGPHAAAARAQEQQPQQPTDERERGIGLYEQGNIKEAVKALRAAVKRDKNDSEAWHYLSLALNRDGDTKGARKAVEKAIELRPDFAPSRAGLAYILLVSDKPGDALREAEAALALDPQNVEAHYVAGSVYLGQFEADKALEEVEAALRAKPDFAPAYLLRSQVLVNITPEKPGPDFDRSPEAAARRGAEWAARMKQAAESLETYFQLNPSPPGAEALREQLANLRVYAGNAGGNAGGVRTVFFPHEVTTKAQILTRPDAKYTEDARKANLSGTVVLHAILGADGTVQNILVVRSLPYGLTKKAIAAAREIKFVPAMKDGRPVSQFIQIEYNFNFY